MNKFTFLCVLSVSLLTTPKTSAQELLSNGTFDANISAWTGSAMPPVWIANDGANASGNGSIEIKDNFNNGGSVAAYSEMVPVKEGYVYLLATSYKYQTATIPNGMSIAIEWFNSNGDSLSEYPWSVRFDYTAPDTWLDFDMMVENIMTGSTHARVNLWIHQHSSGTNFNTGRFDDVILFQDTVFMSDFD